MHKPETCKVIVLDINILSITKFKQIIDRGTRINEEFGKFYFTIIHFRNATDLFADKKFLFRVIDNYDGASKSSRLLKRLIELSNMFVELVEMKML